jgi:hypothetical protein
MLVPRFHFALDVVEKAVFGVLSTLWSGVCARTAYPRGSVYDPNMPEEQDE